MTLFGKQTYTPTPRPSIFLLPSRRSLTSRAAFSPSSRRFLSIILLRSCAALSSVLKVHPIFFQSDFRMSKNTERRTILYIFFTSRKTTCKSYRVSIHGAGESLQMLDPTHSPSSQALNLAGKIPYLWSSQKTRLFHYTWHFSQRLD